MHFPEESLKHSVVLPNQTPYSLQLRISILQNKFSPLVQSKFNDFKKNLNTVVFFLTTMIDLILEKKT